MCKKKNYCVFNLLYRGIFVSQFTTWALFIDWVSPKKKVY